MQVDRISGFADSSANSITCSVPSKLVGGRLHRLGKTGACGDVIYLADPANQILTVRAETQGVQQDIPGPERPGARLRD